jgi:hypothetical protein
MVQQGRGVLRKSDHDFPHLRIRLEIIVGLHQSTGGKADEPTTANASRARGLRTSPTRQSRMYGSENRHSTVDWTFVALVTSPGSVLQLGRWVAPVPAGQVP